MQRADGPAGSAIDLEALARLRHGLQDLERFTEAASREYGCTSAMYHLLLVVKNSRHQHGLDIGMLAQQLRVRHPSAAEMVRKAESAGFLRLSSDPSDARRNLVMITKAGEAVVHEVGESVARQVRMMRPAFIATLHALD
jgi:DNA-binding MarR family transcriptional regulator